MSGGSDSSSGSGRNSCGVARVYRGTFAHSTRDLALHVLTDFVLGVNKQGKIAFFEEGQNVESISHQWGFETSDVVQLGSHEFFMPGMVDTHIHASQYTYSGTHLDLPLLDWLKTYTFPVESRYENLDFAKDVYTKVVGRFTYLAYKHNFGQRALIGKVCMDRNDMVPDYTELTEKCKDETDRDLGKTAKNNDLHIQSHISENKEEVQFVKELFPDCTSYTDVYVKHGLLTNKTVMAHGCYLTDEELKIFHKRGAAVSHCPNSNISLMSGMLNVRNVLKHKVKLGLGTDVAGGYSSSMLDAIRRAVDTSKVLCMQNAALQPLSYREAFYLATLGGSEALSLDDCTGNFEVGKDFDALRVNPCAPGSPIDLFSGDDTEIILEKFLNLGDDRNIVEVYVAGKQVVPLPGAK
ncbi:Guanine deaminase [Bagarius yarrelli]|uniref:Guanine deaminase n=1 Tax=Bagarius yarrelli TaxID=175774 RepID=A0A556V0T1_BAGYA|nr:Guanine deaminase [Bagarius yarrelli]